MIQFDAKKTHAELEKKADETYFKSVDKAKRPLGSTGAGISVHRLSSLRRQRSNLTFDDVSFPNDDVKQRFEEALRRELR